jgi:HAMP domain-containing protein
LLSLVTAISSVAQTVSFSGRQVRVTVPLNSTDTTVITNLVTVGDLDTNSPTPVNFDVFRVAAGAGATLTDPNSNALTSTLERPISVLTLSTTNIAQGQYTFSLNASGGATNNILFVLQAGHVWNGIDQRR